LGAKLLGIDDANTDEIRQAEISMIFAPLAWLIKI
jgi:hypothetical protein